MLAIRTSSQQAWRLLMCSGKRPENPKAPGSNPKPATRAVRFNQASTSLGLSLFIFQITNFPHGKKKKTEFRKWRNPISDTETRSRTHHFWGSKQNMQLSGGLVPSYQKQQLSQKPHPVASHSKKLQPEQSHTVTHTCLGNYILGSVPFPLVGGKPR